jgi:hypothetical protein
MELTDGEGLRLADSDSDMADAAEQLLVNPTFADEQSRLGRLQVERRFSIQATYEPFVGDLETWVRGRHRSVTQAGAAPPQPN